MRKVEIVEDPRSQRCWVAIDVKSGELVMRLHDRGLLEQLCTKLEWKVVDRKAVRSGYQQLDRFPLLAAHRCRR